MGVQLTEVELEIRSTDRECPVLFFRDIVRTGTSHVDCRSSQRHVFCRGIGEDTVFPDSFHFFVIDSHQEFRRIADIADFGRDHRTDIFPCLGVRSRCEVCEERCIDDLDGLGTAVGDTIGVRHIDEDREGCRFLILIDIRCCQIEGIALLIAGDFIVFDIYDSVAYLIGDLDIRDIFCQIIQGERDMEVFFQVTHIDAVEDDGRILDRIIIDLDIIPDFIELEDEDRMITGLEGPSREDAGVVFDTDIGSVVGGILIEDDIAVISRCVFIDISDRLEIPLRVLRQLAIGVLFDEDQFFLFIGSHVLTVDFKGVVASHRIDLEDVGAVSRNSFIGRDRGIDRVKGVVGFLEET